MNYANIFIAVLLFVSGLSADEPALGKAHAWVKVESLNPIAVKGEPIYFRTTKYGTPYAGDLYLDGRLCQRPYPDMGDRPEPTPESKSYAPTVPQFNPKERTSVWPLSNNCDLRLKDMESREYELCYEDPWVKGCARFQLTEPVGEDAKAFAKMNKEAYDYSESSFSGLSPQEIIKEFPTSIYAAWVAFGDANSAQTWRKYESYNILRSNYSLKGEDRAKAEKQANILQSVIDNRPDFPFMTDVKIKYCQWLWTIDRKSECIKHLKVWAKDKDSDLSTWAKKYLDAAERLQKEGKK